jgi:cysteine desulfurase/selenocysteine lyase
MNTNDLNSYGLPDTETLAAWANQLFAAEPGNPAGSAPAARAQSPANDPETRNPDPRISAVSHIPASVAGSGRSPSAVYHGNNVDDLSRPPSSLPDPHFASNNHVPRSSVGSNASPSAQPPVADASPFSSAPSFYFLPGASGLEQQIRANQGISGMARLPYDVNRVRSDFPILQQRVNGRPLIWLDNAATTQKPKQVIERLSAFYEQENSNVHRAAHELAARATDAYETARKKVQRFLNAASVNEIVFVRGSTEAINLVAKSWGEQFLKTGDEIILSHLEHHANIVPWQQLVAKKGLTLKIIPVGDDGQVLLDEYAKLLGPRTRLVSFTQVSNALGTITPAKTIVEMAHRAGAKVLVDGAQAVSHMRADVTALDCDWYVFSGHKVFGPTGIGVLYGKEALLNETEPWQGGGNMIRDVTFEHTTYQQAPLRFEAGTGNIADAVGLGAAIDYVDRIGIDAITQYEHGLLHYATGLLKGIPGLRLIGTAPDKAGVLSFVLDGFRTEDVGAALNREGIAVRSGHHCAQPILRRFGVESSVRPSLALYNTCADIDSLVASLYRIRRGI